MTITFEEFVEQWTLIIEKQMALMQELVTADFTDEQFRAISKLALDSKVRLRANADGVERQIKEKDKLEFTEK